MIPISPYSTLSRRPLLAPLRSFHKHGRVGENAGTYTMAMVMAQFSVMFLQKLSAGP